MSCGSDRTLREIAIALDIHHFTQRISEIVKNWVTIEEKRSHSESVAIPTSEQKTQCYILCCWFTKLYLPINIVRLDERTGNIFVLAGEENIIEIYPNGRWRYIG